MKKLDLITAILLIVGGLNWGFVGILNMDLIGTFFGDMGMMPTILYASVGLSAVYQVICHRSIKERRAECS